MSGELVFKFSWLIGLLLAGYVCGTVAEVRHYRSIRRREEDSRDQALVTFSDTAAELESLKGTLVVGSVVISTDYFKRFVAYLRNLFGGRISAYESLTDRARREAMLRMKEQMPEADMFVNVRIETSSIGKNANKKKVVASVEAIAYGTAIFLAEGNQVNEVYAQKG